MDPERYIAMMNIKEIQKETLKNKNKKEKKAVKKLKKINSKVLKSLCETKPSKYKQQSPKLKRRKIIKAPINNEKFE